MNIVNEGNHKLSVFTSLLNNTKFSNFEEMHYFPLEIKKKVFLQCKKQQN